MTESIELTTTINPHIFPRLYAYLKKCERGRPRASAFKRLAEDYLHAQERVNAPETSQTVGTTERTPTKNEIIPNVDQPDEAVAKSLGQFSCS
jgi:citrate synthase